MNRPLAAGGVVGPAAFIGAWAIAGSSTANYSAVNDAISDLAAVHAPMQALMTAGFVVYGLGLIAFGIAFAKHSRLAWMAAVATGRARLESRRLPSAGGQATRCTAHSRASVDARSLPSKCWPSLRWHVAVEWAGRGSGVAAMISATCLAASTLGPAHGLFQRLGSPSATCGLRSPHRCCWRLCNRDRARDIVDDSRRDDDRLRRFV